MECKYKDTCPNFHDCKKEDVLDCDYGLDRIAGERLLNILRSQFSSFSRTDAEKPVYWRE